MNPQIELLNEDCLSVMARYPDKHFDLAICDPPYGINVGAMGLGKGKKKTSFENKNWDNETPNAEYFEQLMRVSENQIIWGGNYFDLPKTKCWLIWDKVQEFSGADFEMAWTSFDSPSKAFRKSRVVAHTEDFKIHPTQKPTSLYKFCLMKYANPNDKILDTHLGSASSAIAVHEMNTLLNMNLSFVGTEIDSDYFTDAKERFELVTSQRKLEFA